MTTPPCSSPAGPGRRNHDRRGEGAAFGCPAGTERIRGTPYRGHYAGSKSTVKKPNHAEPAPRQHDRERKTLQDIVVGGVIAPGVSPGITNGEIVVCITDPKEVKDDIRLSGDGSTKYVRKMP